MSLPQKRLLAMAIVAIFANTPNQLYASGFSLYNEMSGANVGDFAAGGAAEAADAATLFYNPAGLITIKNQQLVISGTGVFNNASFTGSESPTGSGTLYTANNVQGGETALVPAIFYAFPLGNGAVAGLGIYVPFGLATDWGINSSIRYSATRSELKTINIAPALSGYITDTLSLGIASDIQYSEVELNQVIGNPGAPSNDHLSKNKGHSWSLGAHGGILYQPNKKTRIGLNYQSAMKHRFKGDSTLIDLSDNTTAAYNDDLFSYPIDLPAQSTLSAYYELTDKIAIKGTVAYTQWSSFNEITVNGIAISGTQTETMTVPENFRDTWRIVGGANFKANDKLMLRVGAGFDQNPTNDTDRNLRLPDNNRIGVAVGGRYQFNKHLRADIGYTHLFIKNTPIDNTHNVNVSSFITTGNVKANVNLVGAQLTWNIT